MRMGAFPITWSWQAAGRSLVRWQGQISAKPRTWTTSIDLDFGKVEDLYMPRTCLVGRSPDQVSPWVPLDGFRALPGLLDSRTVGSDRSLGSPRPRACVDRRRCYKGSEQKRGSAGTVVMTCPLYLNACGPPPFEENPSFLRSVEHT